MVAPVREQVWSARNSREKYFYFFLSRSGDAHADDE